MAFILSVAIELTDILLSSPSFNIYGHLVAWFVFVFIQASNGASMA